MDAPGIPPECEIATVAGGFYAPRRKMTFSARMTVPIIFAWHA